MNKYLEKIAERGSYSRELILHPKVLDGATKTLKTERHVAHDLGRAAKTVGKVVKNVAKKTAIGAGLAGAAYVAGKDFTGSKDRDDHMFKGNVSTAWQEAAIAKDHGKKRDVGFWTSHIHGSERVKRQVNKDSLKFAWKGALAGGVVGAAAAWKNGKKIGRAGKAGALLGGFTGMWAGGVHGQNKGIRNEADRAHKKYASEILEKVSAMLGKETQKDLANTATIGALGGVATLGAHNLLANKKIFKNPGTKAVFAVGTGLGLAADYLGLKLKKHIDHGIDKIS